MNRAQKIARFNLIEVMMALILSVMAVGVLYFVVGLPMQRAFGGFAFIAICGLTGLSPVLYKKEPGKVSFDERDLLIHKKASLGAYSIFGFFSFSQLRFRFLFWVQREKYQSNICRPWFSEVCL